MNKEAFVTAFGEFLKENCSVFDSLEKLIYVEDTNGEEYVYVVYKGNSQKRIDVSADSDFAIMKDVLRRVEENPWLMPEDKVTI